MATGWTQEVMQASTERVAVDVAGVVILRLLGMGTMPDVSSWLVFQWEQIARSRDLGLGMSSPKQILRVT